MSVTKERIIETFENPRIARKAVSKALMLIFKRQTYDEQEVLRTKYTNGIGFTGPDARQGSKDALFYKRHGYISNQIYHRWMKKNKTGARRIAKYWRQLQEEALKKVQHGT